MTELINADTMLFGWSATDVVKYFSAYNRLTNGAIWLIRVVMVLSEIASFVSKSRAASSLRPPRPLLLAHEHTTTVGAVLIGVTVLQPILAIALWIA